jgi:uncharacterized protein (TIGR00299 family) protein
MRIAYLECFSGISGDMFLGALVDAGVPGRVLEEAVAALGVGAELRLSRVDRRGIAATMVDVVVEGEVDRPRSGMGEEQNLETRSSPRSSAEDVEKYDSHDSANETGRGRFLDHGHGHTHSEEHSHDHRHEAAHAREDAHASRTGVSAPPSHDSHVYKHSHGRHLSEIKRTIGAAAISEGAKRKAIAIFEALGAAESKIHNLDIEHVHFHEVGAVDAMVDIVGAAVGAEALGVDEIVCSALNVGGGTVKCAHGVFPVPAPATVELLKGAPVYSSGVQAELVTPTGAAIVKTLASRFGDFPPMKLNKIGYGAGSRDFAEHANVVRITVGESVDAKYVQAISKCILASPEIQSKLSRKVDQQVASVSAEATTHAFAEEHAVSETITVLEANLDDLNPQVFGYVMDHLLATGALDAFAVPVQMKKNRPGTLLTVLCKPEDAQQMVGILFAETTTLGLRRREEQRHVLARRWETVSTPWGDVRMKIGSLNGAVTNYAPEYEDCRTIAEEKRVPLKSVMLEAMQAYLLGLAAKQH